MSGGIDLVGLSRQVSEYRHAAAALTAAHLVEAAAVDRLHAAQQVTAEADATARRTAQDLLHAVLAITEPVA